MSQVIYCPIILVTKLSILLLYLRVFGPKRMIYIAIHLLLWANCLFYTAGLIFQCNPIRKAWRTFLPGTCINQRAAQLASAVFNTFSDFAILILPMRAIWELKLPSGQKMGVLAVLGAGLLYVPFHPGSI